MIYNIEGAEWLLKNIDVEGMSVLEFGNQHVWEHAMRRLGIRFPVARDWFMDMGAKEYVCIDTNGHDSAIPMDLSAPLEKPYDVMLGRFDIVTNIGCSEHCGKEPRKQWNVFAHANNFCAPLGHIVHHLPPAGQWLDHCDVWYRDGFGRALELCTDARLMSEERINLATLNPDADYLSIHLMRRPGMPDVPYNCPSPMFSEKLHHAP